MDDQTILKLRIRAAEALYGDIIEEIHENPDEDINTLIKGELTGLEVDPANLRIGLHDPDAVLEEARAIVGQENFGINCYTINDLLIKRDELMARLQGEDSKLRKTTYDPMRTDPVVRESMLQRTHSSQVDLEGKTVHTYDFTAK